MVIEWLTMKDLADECGVHPRTFRNNYAEEYPPDRKVGARKWWKRDTADSVKLKAFGIGKDNKE